MSKLNIEQADLAKVIKMALVAQKRVLNIQDLILYTGYSDKQLYRLTHLKLIPFSKPTNGKVFFERVLIEEWLLKNPISTSQELDNFIDDHLRKKNKSA